MYSSSPGFHSQTAESSKFSRQFQTAEFQVLLIKALHALKETLMNVKKLYKFSAQQTSIDSTFIPLHSFLLN